eukprot:CAMPEP_0179151590 /NCGR_PEP_ID=MMETSP0796-20121207/73609_1 /TAXON_ID=73915 /ORGANISM="Pyrodinium bahamense, Strain pbaha01" /LENGTH=36 /DNA_ID= /DNA_START= /DNA_END= /DNA_ORIENTATION=
MTALTFPPPSSAPPCMDGRTDAGSRPAKPPNIARSR